MPKVEGTMLPNKGKALRSFRRGCGDETWSAVINIYAGTLLAVSLLGAERLYSRQQHLQEDVLHPSKSWRVVSASLQDLREELVSSPITEAICFVCEKEPLQRFVRRLNVFRCGLLGHVYLLLPAGLTGQERSHW